LPRARLAAAGAAAGCGAGARLRGAARFVAVARRGPLALDAIRGTLFGRARLRRARLRGARLGRGFTPAAARLVRARLGWTRLRRARLRGARVTA
jgi:uncharacterized protein YjbI with pentapeptide repeats